MREGIASIGTNECEDDGECGGGDGAGEFAQDGFDGEGFAGADDSAWGEEEGFVVGVGGGGAGARGGLRIGGSDVVGGVAEGDEGEVASEGSRGEEEGVVGLEGVGGFGEAIGIGSDLGDDVIGARGEEDADIGEGAS